MSETAFSYDVFLSHSAKDKAVVRPLAERLRTRLAEADRRRRKDGLKVWPVAPKRPRGGGFDECECPSPAGAGEGGRRPGEGRGAQADSIPAKIDPPPLQSCGGTREGLEHPRVLACPAEAGRRRRVLCLSAPAFGLDWAQLEAGTWCRGCLPIPKGLCLSAQRWRCADLG